MPKGSIYVTCGGEKDLSRWLTIAPTSEGQCVVKLQDLVHPGMPSGLKQFECPASLLRDVQREGFFQVTNEQGYCQMRALQDSVEISFRGSEDGRIQTCEVARPDYDALVEQVAPTGASLH